MRVKPLLHPDTMRQIDSEPPLQDWLANYLKRWFILKRECEGQDIRTGATGRIDFLAYPRQRLIAAGFDPLWFGIEVKYSERWDGKTPVYQLFSQAQAYTRGLYDVGDGHKVELPFVCVFTNAQLTTGGTGAAWGHIASMMGRLHVGTLNLRRDYHTNALCWRIQFSTGPAYFDSNPMRRGQSNAGLAYYFGNVAQKRGLITDHVQDTYYDDAHAIQAAQQQAKQAETDGFVF